MKVVPLPAEDDDLNIIRRDRIAEFARYGAILYADLSPVSTKDWLVHRLLGAGDGSAAYGKPGDGKSVLVQDMALHVSAGLPWFGRPVKRGAVVYVALERKKLVERRAIAFRKKHGLEDLPFAIVGGVHDFRDQNKPEFIAEICRKVDEATTEPVVLIVIDTLSRALCGGDENSPKDMGAIVNATSRLQEATKAHVLWVHHIPQDGSERMRGHGALLGALDTTILVEKASASYRTATVIKANDSEEGERIAFSLESVVIGGEGENETTAPVVVPAEQTGEAEADQRLTRNQQTMYGILADAGRPLSTDEWNNLAREAGLGRSRRADLHDYRTALKSKGMIWETSGGWIVKH
jgi:hypothetical protein